MSPTLRRFALWFEFTFIFIAIPIAFALVHPPGTLALIIWGTGLYSWLVLYRHGYRWGAEWNAAAVTRENMRPIVRRFLPNAVITFAFTCTLVPEHLFDLLVHAPVRWAVIMVLYPLLSVIPQEIIFRSFFVMRYATLIPPARMQAINSLLFGWVHIIMHNWVAMVFSGVGGWMFYDTYRKHRSVALTALEHSLYGCFVFTIGLGFYFYHGNLH